MFQGYLSFRRGSQVVRPRSAKPLFIGSTPIRASKLTIQRINDLQLQEHWFLVVFDTSESGLKASQKGETIAKSLT